jgi:hypothetical protein
MFQDITNWFKSPNGIFQLLGLFGYLILISEMLFHSIKTYKTKKIKDITWKWILSYLIGALFLFTYSLYLELWAIFFPICLQIFIIIIVINMKMFLKQENSESLLNDEEQPKKNSEESSQEFNLDSPYQKLSDDNRYHQLTPSDKHAYQQFSPAYELPYEGDLPDIDDNAYNDNDEPILPQLL